MKRFLQTHLQAWHLAVFFLIIIIALLAVIVIGKVRDYRARTIHSEPEETVEVIPEPALNTHNGRFYHGEDSYLHYDGETTAHLGIDVSSHQKEIDWEKVGQTPVEFAIIRIGYRGYTEGAISEDKYFRDNLDGARAQGLKLGVYFFSQAISVEEALEEAEFVLSLLDGTVLDYPVFFDWEDIEPEARTDYMDSILLTACAEAFCKRIEEGGYTAGIYFNQRFGYQEFNLLQLEQYDFWLADYSIPSHFRYDYDYLQYSSTGHVYGIETNVDLNLCFD